MFENILAEAGRAKTTKAQIAKILGISRASVKYRFDGKREFTLSEIEKLARYFNVSIDYLVGFERSSPPPSA